jgi:protein TonB
MVIPTISFGLVSRSLMLGTWIFWRRPAKVRCLIASMTNSHISLLSAEITDPRVRVPLVASLTLLLWLGMLVIFSLLLNQSPVSQSNPSPVELQMIDLTGEGLAGGEGGSAATASASTVQAKPSAGTKIKPTQPNLAAVHAHPDAVHVAHLRRSEPAKAPVQFHEAAPVHRLPDTEQFSSLQPDAPVMAGSRKATSSSATGDVGGSKGISAGRGSGAGADSSAGIGSGSGTGSGGGFGTGGAGPRPLYAPVPSIPDDLRDEVMQATAVVRFHVSRDGQASVALVTSTDYSELDDLILETLRQWRFAPAVHNGIKIDSDAEIRLLVSVH